MGNAGLPTPHLLWRRHVALPGPSCEAKRTSSIMAFYGILVFRLPLRLRGIFLSTAVRSCASEEQSQPTMFWTDVSPWPRMTELRELNLETPFCYVAINFENHPVYGAMRLSATD